MLLGRQEHGNQLALDLKCLIGCNRRAPQLTKRLLKALALCAYKDKNSGLSQATARWSNGRAHISGVSSQHTTRMR